MVKKYLRVLISITIAVLFLWLALKDISYVDIRLTMNRLTYHWLVPFIAVSLFSHYLRAERWKQLMEQNGTNTSRVTLFSGVMLGYLVNYAVPRLGEVTRSVYVGNKEQISRSKLMGTVLLERALDLFVMLAIVIFIFIYLITDFRIIVSLLGVNPVKWMQTLLSLDGMLFMGLVLSIILLVLYLLYQLMLMLGRWIPSIYRLMNLTNDIFNNFIQGLLSIRAVKNWPLFLLLTAGIWFCYVLMTYIPFTAFDMHVDYGLGMREALIITMVSALGMSLPSPGGIGTYHLFVSRALVLFFAVPEAVGISYTIVTHLVMMIIILIFTPIILAVNRSASKVDQHT
ncbi:MAG: lysylphosphatidylglycerol synthase transmembrane domain-containing protein [Balneolales bacterium]